ncbi:COR domain-containing protein, partial [Lewinella sp. JB7]|uniref:COR domain-containing protein n=1 Tax=Lewinella sp. JB7 TaxID=2962887 RepID=UPI0020C9FA57
LSGTQFDSALDLAALTNLQHLDLYNTFQKQLPPELYLNVFNCLPNLMAWRRDLDIGSYPNDIYKIQICGNGTVGKSSIIDRLVFNRYEEDRSSTHGIRLVVTEEAKSFAFSYPPVRLLIWDFGGQDIYHQAHRIFLRDRAINLLVFDTDTYYHLEQTDPITGQKDPNRKLSYWLNDIAGNAPNSQIIIIQNKCERGVPDISIQEDIPSGISVEGPIQVSAKTGRRIEELGEAIHEAIQRLPHAKMEMPESWYMIGQEIMDLRRRKEKQQISRSEFSQICQKHRLVPNSESALLTYLDGLGLILQDPDLLPDQIIIDQEWAFNAIYTILQRFDHSKSPSLAERAIFFFQEKCRLDNGQFVPRELPFDQNHYSKEEQSIFLNIMQRAGICFKTQAKKKDASIYQLFHLMAIEPPKAAEDVWADAGSQIEFTQRYIHRYHLHRGIFRDVVQKISSKVKLRHLWQDGLLLQLPDRTIARLEMHYSGGYLQLQARGSKAAELLLYFNELLDTLLRGDQYFQKHVSLDGQVFFPVTAIQDAIQSKSDLAKNADGRFHDNWRMLTWATTKVDEYDQFDFDNLPTVPHDPAPYIGISEEKITEDLERRERENLPLPEDISQEQADRFLQVFSKAVKSPISKEAWIIIRSVIVLLIAYIIWALFEKEILAFFN